jgi:hypothetical protein
MWRVWWQNGIIDDAFPVGLRGFCFTCAFWHELSYTDDKDPKGTVIVSSITFSPPFGNRETRTHYRFDSAEPMVTGNRASFSNSCLGHGGRVFTIKFFGRGTAVDGRDRVVTTNNLWHQGTIPEAFYDLFPVNAEFVTD